MARVVCGREKTGKAGTHTLILESFLRVRHSHHLHNVLEENFDEYTRARRGVLFCQRDHRQHVPRNRITGQDVAPQTGVVAQLAGLAAMDVFVIFGKCALKQLHPQSIELG